MTVETNETSAAPAGRRRAGPSPLRKLNDEQERELTRLYSDTDTPIGELASRFGVGESSVYRIVQKHGAKLRGARTAGADAKPKVEVGAAPVQPAATPAARAPQQAATGGALRRFRIAYVGETVVEAENIRDAIARAEALGATDITSILSVD